MDSTPYNISSEVARVILKASDGAKLDNLSTLKNSGAPDGRFHRKGMQTLKTSRSSTSAAEGWALGLLLLLALVLDGSFC